MGTCIITVEDACGLSALLLQNALGDRKDVERDIGFSLDNAASYEYVGIDALVVVRYRMFVYCLCLVDGVYVVCLCCAMWDVCIYLFYFKGRLMYVMFVYVMHILFM